MKEKSILIHDTTREEREKIIEESLNCGDPCSSCDACGGLEIDYQEYIDGKRELRELNDSYRANYMKSSNEPEIRHGCPL
jgi:hypothetical protein